MPFLIIILLSLVSFSLANNFWQVYFVLWGITIMPTAIVTFGKFLKTSYRRIWAYAFVTCAIINFAASMGFFLSFGQYWATLFMAVFTAYWAAVAWPLCQTLTSVKDTTRTTLRFLNTNF